MKTIISNYFNLIKKYLYIVLGILFLISIVYSVIITKRYMKTDNEKTVAVMNFFNSQFKLDSVLLENGKFLYSVNDLELKTKDLKRFNSQLNEKLNQTEIELKNIKSVTSIATEINITKDSGINVQQIESKLDTNIYQAIYNDKWINFNETLSLVNNVIQVESISISIKDSIYVVPEVIMERWLKWYKFWKEPIGVKTNVVMINPYSKVKNIESYQIIK